MLMAPSGGAARPKPGAGPSIVKSFPRLRTASTVETYDSYSDEEDEARRSSLTQKAMSKIKERRGRAKEAGSCGSPRGYDADESVESVESEESGSYRRSAVDPPAQKYTGNGGNGRCGGERASRLSSTVRKYMRKCEGSKRSKDDGTVTTATGARSSSEASFRTSAVKLVLPKKAHLNKSARRQRRRTALAKTETTASAPVPAEEAGGHRHRKIKAFAVRTRKEWNEKRWTKRQLEEAAMMRELVAQQQKDKESSEKENESRTNANEGGKTFMDFVEHLLVEVDAAKGYENTPETSVGEALPKVEEVDKEWTEGGKGGYNNESSEGAENAKFLGGPDLPKPALRRYPTSPPHPEGVSLPPSKSMISPGRTDDTAEVPCNKRGEVAAESGGRVRPLVSSFGVKDRGSVESYSYLAAKLDDKVKEPRRQERMALSDDPAETCPSEVEF